MNRQPTSARPLGAGTFGPHSGRLLLVSARRPYRPLSSPAAPVAGLAAPLPSVAPHVAGPSAPSCPPRSAPLSRSRGNLARYTSSVASSAMPVAAHAAFPTGRTMCPSVLLWHVCREVPVSAALSDTFRVGAARAASLHEAARVAPQRVFKPSRPHISSDSRPHS